MDEFKKTFRYIKKANLEKEYLTVKQVADFFGVTPLTLRNWDKSGKLRAMRNPLNNYRIYKAQDIKLLLRKIESKGKIFLG